MIRTLSILAEYANVKRTAKSETVTWLNNKKSIHVEVREVAIADEKIFRQIHHEGHWYILEQIRGYRFTFEIGGHSPCTYVHFYEPN